MSSNSEIENENQIKHNSDTSFLSESSDNLTDYSSETSNFKKNKYDTKYPKFPKSKSFKLKKKFPEISIKNIVNEEQNEDDKENESEKKFKIPKKKFIVDITSELSADLSKFGKLKNKSFRESNLMDTIYEIKEEQCPDVSVNKKSLTELQSPQIKFLTDNIEDTTVCQTYFNSNHIPSFKYDYTKEDSVITEDNNENNLEFSSDFMKSHSNKKIESFIDKSENFDEQINSRKSVSDLIIETIKEENNEEEEVNSSSKFAQNKLNNHEFLLFDEFGPNNKTKFKYKLSLKNLSYEENNKIINELDDEF